ncbi:MAG: hypothetical protein KGR22_01850 [Planctomycetes bacterium]|nr:hypothetical protein [Planctomycetota bacterium]
MTTLLAALALAIVPPSIPAPAKERAAQAPPVQAPSDLPPVPATPAAPISIVAVQPFTIAEPYRHRFRKDGAEFTSGHLIVLRAEAGFVQPRQVAEPVLCVGSQTAERLWSDPAKGLMVAIVPAWTERADGGTERPGDPSIDLVWFAAPELPERVDAAWIAAERARAEAALAGGRLSTPSTREIVRHPSLTTASQDALIARASALVPDPAAR